AGSRAGLHGAPHAGSLLIRKLEVLPTLTRGALFPREDPARGPATKGGWRDGWPGPAAAARARGGGRPAPCGVHAPSAAPHGARRPRDHRRPLAPRARGAQRSAIGCVVTA